MKKIKLICGIGINDADYVTQRNEAYIDENGTKKYRSVFKCPFYRKWADMIRRCYSKISLSRSPTYVGYTVCDAWLYFSNFKAWMESQDWEGKDLDKDLRIKGNKIYGPDTCLFITREVNSFILESRSRAGASPLGVHVHTETKRYIATISLSGLSTHLGCFDSPEEAHQAWKEAKNKLAIELASRQTCPITAQALIDRYN